MENNKAFQLIERLIITVIAIELERIKIFSNTKLFIMNFYFFNILKNTQDSGESKYAC